MTIPHFYLFFPTPHFDNFLDKYKKNYEGKLFLHVWNDTKKYYIIFYKEHCYIHQQAEIWFEITVSGIKKVKRKINIVNERLAE